MFQIQNTNIICFHVHTHIHTHEHVDTKTSRDTLIHLNIDEWKEEKEENYKCYVSVSTTVNMSSSVK